MEPFIDFGFIEFIVFVGIAWLAFQGYSYSKSRWFLLGYGVIAPVFILIFVNLSGLLLWITVAALIVGIINTYVIVCVSKSVSLPELLALEKKQMRDKFRKKFFSILKLMRRIVSPK
jgi:hypothetical protein